MMMILVQRLHSIRSFLLLLFMLTTQKTILSFSIRFISRSLYTSRFIIQTQQPTFVLSSLSLSVFSFNSHSTSTTSKATTTTMKVTTTTSDENTATDQEPPQKWMITNIEQAIYAKEILDIWPLDESNVALLNEVHPYGYKKSTNTIHDIYDIIAIGSGAGGLVTSKQSGRRGAKSALISEKLAGGDCLNVGCVPSKALLHAAITINTIRSGQVYMNQPNNHINKDDVNFSYIMKRMRELRSQISPADGHDATVGTGAHVYQGRGIFTSPNTMKVVNRYTNEIIVPELKFHKAVIATGGKPYIPNNIPGLIDAPYTTNESIFNLEVLPDHMIILGSGVVALEMAYCFASFGSKVTVIHRSTHVFESKYGDIEASNIIQSTLEKLGVTFINETKMTNVETTRSFDKHDNTILPLMKVSIETNNKRIESSTSSSLECECLLIATGRVPNVENLGLKECNVEYNIQKGGILINDYGQSISNSNIYAVGDCVANMPRLTHVAGEMAKLVIQNSIFNDTWKVSSLIIPAVMYMKPEYATVGISSQNMANQHNIPVDTYYSSLQHNDRAILEESNIGYCNIICKKNTDIIIGCTIVCDRAGEMINELTLAIKNNIGLRAIGRNIHSYPTLGEAVMSCGILYINANAAKMTQTTSINK